MHDVSSALGERQLCASGAVHLGLPDTNGALADVIWGVLGALTTGVVPLIVMSLLQIIGGGAGAAGAMGCMVTGSTRTKPGGSCGCSGCAGAGPGTQVLFCTMPGGR